MNPQEHDKATTDEAQIRAIVRDELSRATYNFGDPAQCVVTPDMLREMRAMSRERRLPAKAKIAAGYVFQFFVNLWIRITGRQRDRVVNVHAGRDSFAHKKQKNGPV